MPYTPIKVEELLEIIRTQNRIRARLFAVIRDLESIRTNIYSVMNNYVKEDLFDELSTIISRLHRFTGEVDMCKNQTNINSQEEYLEMLIELLQEEKRRL